MAPDDKQPPVLDAVRSDRVASSRWLGSAELTRSAAVIALAWTLAVFSAQDFAGGWNDRSRLATVECLVDYRTWAIDRSVFFAGTGDKVFIDGQFYSHKSPVPALAMAGVYQAWQWATGMTARGHTAEFCYWMTLVFSGLAYVFSVWCSYRLGLALGLSAGRRLALAASFALATTALPYARHVNDHILLLAVAWALVLGLSGLVGPMDRSCGPNRVPWLRLAGLGSLAGLGATIDLGAGPVLFLCAASLVVFQGRSMAALAAFVLGAAPWLVLHFAINYALGGTFLPLAAVPEYFRWPGSVFDAANLTGSWNHADLGSFLTYAAALLVSDRGFLFYNLPLLLAVPLGAKMLLRRAAAPEPLSALVIFAFACCVGTWILYAVNSTNYSGVCCSVRWFVPLLAPGYLVLGVAVSRTPGYWGDFLILSVWGVLVGALMWRNGPWVAQLAPSFWPDARGGPLGEVIRYGRHALPSFWPFVVGALLSWTAVRVFRLGRRKTRLGACQSAG